MRDSISIIATRETRQLTHQKRDGIVQISKINTRSLPGEIARGKRIRRLGIRLYRIHCGMLGYRYVACGERKTKYYKSHTLTSGYIKHQHKAVRNMIAIKDRERYAFLNEYQPLFYRR